jgi:prepilin-type N-terminal cleavage/methylation domain-containing protein
MSHDRATNYGFALIEVLVVVLVVGIVATTAVLIVGGVHATRADHSCWNEAQQFQQLVRNYGKKHHGAVPGFKESRSTAPNVTNAILVMMKDNKEIGAIETSHSGEASNEWSYDATNGIVTPGKSCM